MTMPFIVAELSCSHTGSLQRARYLVVAAAAAGADAIKLQTWTPDTMVVDPNAVVESGPWAGRNMMDLYREAHTPWEWHAELFALAKECGMVGFSSVFDVTALEFLESIDCPMYKIASFELVDLDLIRAVAATGKPVIISTGMATQEELYSAFDALYGCEDLTVLICASAYPATPADYSISSLAEYVLQEYKIGLSDHTRGHALAIAAQSMGVTMIEKHLGFSDGLDAEFAATPEEFAEMTKLMRQVAPALDDEKPVLVGPGPSEMPQYDLRRSLYTRLAVRKGERIPEDAIVTARPAKGAPCSARAEFIGKVAKVDIAAGEPIGWHLFT